MLKIPFPKLNVLPVFIYHRITTVGGGQTAAEVHPLQAALWEGDILCWPPRGARGRQAGEDTNRQVAHSNMSPSFINYYTPDGLIFVIP